MKGADYMTKVLSFINQKGGVGKSVCSFNIGVALQDLYKKRVLFIDFDPQSSLTDLIVDNPDDVVFTIYDVLKNKESFEEAIFESDNGYSVIPSSISLTDYESVKKAGKLLTIINEIKETGLYDYIIVDCPPSLNILSVNALIATDYIVCVVKPDLVSTKGIALLNKTIHELEVKAPLYLIVNQYKKRKLADLTVQMLKDDYKVFNTVIRDTAVISESASLSQNVFSYRKYGNQGADDFKALAKEILNITK